MMPDIEAIRSDIERGRTAASEIAQLRLLAEDARRIRAALTLARSRWTAIRRHERALYNWLDDAYGETPPTDDDWIAVLGVYEQVVDVRRLLAETGREAAA